MHSNNFERSFRDRTCVLDFLKQYFREQKAEEKYRNEIEYLFFEHAYFVPSKEIILADVKSPWLLEFQTYALSCYPELFKNPYISKLLSKKDKILLFFMKREQYQVMNFLSDMRKKMDSRKKNVRRNEMQKILTITIPSYNVEKYLKQTLDSFLDESILDVIEVLIVDDGSKDSTAVIGKDYEEKYPNSFG